MRGGRLGALGALALTMGLVALQLSAGGCSGTTTSHPSTATSSGSGSSGSQSVRFILRAR